jgi:hypothetical protein
MVGEESRLSMVRRLPSTRAAIALGVLAFALNIAALVLIAAAGQTAPQLVRFMALLPTVAVGMLVAVRRPGNPLGWLMLGCGVMFSLQAGAVAYSVLDYRLHHGTLPLGRLAIALQAAWAGGLVLTAGCLWLFPDGHLPRGRWRPVGGALFALGLLFGAVMFVAFAIAAAAPVVRVDASGTPFTIDHPSGSMLLWVVVVNIGFFALLVSWVVWLAVQVPKYRRSSGERRLQLKWLYSGAAVFIACLGFGLFQSNNATGVAGVVGAVIAAGVAAARGWPPRALPGEARPAGPIRPADLHSPARAGRRPRSQRHQCSIGAALTTPMFHRCCPGRSWSALTTFLAPTGSHRPRRYHSTSVQISGRGASPTSTEANLRAASFR